MAGDGSRISISNQAGSTPGGFFGFSAPGQTNDGRSGPINFEARMSDAQGSSFGVAYTANYLNPSTGLDANGLIGTAIFGAEAPAGGGGGDTGGIGDFDVAGANTFAAQAYILPVAGLNLRVQQLQPLFGGTNQGVTPNRAELDDAGGLERIVSLTSAGVAATVLERRTAQNLEIGGDSNLIAGRWSDGAIKSFISAADNVGPNQGFHYLLARGLENPVAIAPRRIDYTLDHATSPTLGSGAAAPGTFSANLAIDFGAAPLLGIDGTIAFEGAGGFVYTFASAGGAADPSKAIQFAVPDIRGRGGHFSFTTDSGTTNHGFTGQLTGFGSLGDAQGSSVGFAYSVDLSAPSAIIGETIAGAAIFRSDGNNSAAAAPSRTTASIAPSAAPIAGIDMNRWGGTASASPQGTPAQLAGLEPALVPPALAAGAGAARGDALARREAIRQAERLMGGMITFPSAPPEKR